MDKVNRKLPTIQILKVAWLVKISGDIQSIFCAIHCEWRNAVICVNMLENAATLIRQLKSSMFKPAFINGGVINVGEQHLPHALNIHTPTS